MLVCVFGELGRTSLELDAVQVCALGSSPPHILHTPAARALLVVVICAHAFGELPGLQEEPQIAAFLTLHSCHSVAGHRSYNGRHQEAPLHRVWKLPLNEHLQAKSHTSACDKSENAFHEGVRLAGSIFLESLELEGGGRVYGSVLFPPAFSLGITWPRRGRMGAGYIPPSPKPI